VILDDEANQDVLRWMPDGKAFTVVNHKKFTLDKMPKLFNIRNMSSFVRKLGRWGFSRVHEQKTGNSDIFRHECFVRGNLDLCRKKVKCIGRAVSSSASSVNNNTSSASNNSNNKRVITETTKLSSPVQLERVVTNSSTSRLSEPMPVTFTRINKNLISMETTPSTLLYRQERSPLQASMLHPSEVSMHSPSLSNSSNSNVLRRSRHQQAIMERLMMQREMEGTMAIGSSRRRLEHELLERRLEQELLDRELRQIAYDRQSLSANALVPNTNRNHHLGRISNSTLDSIQRESVMSQANLLAQRSLQVNHRELAIRALLREEEEARMRACARSIALPSRLSSMAGGSMVSSNWMTSARGYP
jgi:hypothetical protein